MAVHYVLIAACLAYPVYKAAQGLRELLREPAGPLLLYHKPTGKIITIPREYESGAVDQLIADFNSLPPHVMLNSPEFQVL